MGEVMKEAAFSLAEAKFTTGDFNQVVLQNVTKAQIKIRSKKDNVAGNLHSKHAFVNINIWHTDNIVYSKQYNTELIIIRETKENQHYLHRNSQALPFLFIYT